MSTPTAEQRAREAAARIHRRARDEEALISDEELGGIICAAIREAEAAVEAKWGNNYKLACHNASTAIARSANAEAEMLQWRILAQEMTPGGSEFMSREVTRDYYRAFKDSAHKAKVECVKLQRDVDLLLSALEVQATFFPHTHEGLGCTICARIRAAREAVETVEKVNQKRAGYEEPNARIGSGTNIPSEVAGKPHNPSGLTPEQVGVADGWRLLDQDENGFNVNPKRRCDFTGAFQAWRKTKWESGSLNGLAGDVTYRTKLTRAELRKARGLEPVANRGTPETDAAKWIETGTRNGEVVLASFAGTLESSRDESREQLAQGNALLRVLRDQVAEGNKSARELREQLSVVTKERNYQYSRISWLEQQREVEIQQKEAALKESGECLAESNQLREQVAKLKAERDGWETVSAQLRAQLTQAAGVEDKRWTLEDVVALTEAYHAPRKAIVAAIKAKAKRVEEDAVFFAALAGEL